MMHSEPAVASKLSAYPCCCPLRKGYEVGVHIGLEKQRMLGMSSVGTRWQAWSRMPVPMYFGSFLRRGRSINLSPRYLPYASNAAQ